MNNPPVPYDKSLISKLNNYGYSENVKEEIREFKRSAVVPDTVKGKKRYVEKWTPFYIDNQTDHLIYRPNNLKVIIDPDEKQLKLKELYENPRFGVGSGQRQFYYMVCSKYLNIFREEVAEFLRRQKNYQMTRNTRHHINKPILASAPNERYGIDLVDFQRYETKNRGFRYALTCIDHYSRYVWAKPLKNKTAQDVSRALQSIFDDAGVTPHIIQKDNGGEFQGETNTLLRRHNIEAINTLSYSPQSNGLIENFNNQLRKMLRELMIRNNNLIWYNQLDLCCSIKNKQKNGTTKRRPIDVWTATPYVQRDRRNIFDDTANNIRAKAKENVEKNKTREFAVGDFVRVKMSQLYSQLREKIKSGDKKYIIVKYTPEVYQIDHVLLPDNHGYEKLRYTLKTLDGEPLITQQKMNNPNAERRQKRFFASDFIKVKEEDVGTNGDDGFTIHDALKLNQITDAETDARRPRPVIIRREPREPTPIVPREPSRRVRRPNQFIFNDNFVTIGGEHHNV